LIAARQLGYTTAWDRQTLFRKQQGFASALYPRYKSRSSDYKSTYRSGYSQADLKGSTYPLCHKVLLKFPFPVHICLQPRYRGTASRWHTTRNFCVVASAGSTRFSRPTETHASVPFPVQVGSSSAARRISMSQLFKIRQSQHGRTRTQLANRRD